MKVLVTGANGQLGNEIRLAAKGSSHDLIFTDVNQQDGQETVYLDITDSEAVLSAVEQNNVNVIVNCAAFTNVDAAESNFALAEKLNADAPANLARAIHSRNGLLIHISTDYVFGMEPYNTPCKEDQKGTPTGVYGLTKLHGEQRILTEGCDHVIVRTAWLYSEFGKNFCKTMLNLTATKPQLKVVFDQVGTPTYAWDLALAILRVIDDYEVNGGRNCGIYHYSNEGVCSWYDFTKMIQEYSGQAACDVQPCHSNEFPSPVARPAYSVLDKTKIKETFGVEVPYWTDSLRKCIENIKKEWK